MQTKYISAPENCTGCALCANVCTMNAITMSWSDDGFSIPKVDADKCINCGACTRYCIAHNPPANTSADLNAVKSYGAWISRPEEHEKSSSGGVFSALAADIIQQGGVVFGVVWQNSTTAAFCKAETIEDISAMRGSKYTQALPALVYRSARQELQQKRKVLFTGTPCQIHALKKYLRKDYENLITMDLVCHGVPSHLILDKYITEAESKSGQKIDHISFRDKHLNWNNFCITRHYIGGMTESTVKDKDVYMQLFLSDQALNKSCYSCAFAKIPRQGDITIGDYWGVSPHEHPEWPVNRGISSVLANTEKGGNTLKKLQQTGALNLFPEPFIMAPEFETGQ